MTYPRSSPSKRKPEPSAEALPRPSHAPRAPDAPVGIPRSRTKNSAATDVFVGPVAPLRVRIRVRISVRVTVGPPALRARASHGHAGAGTDVASWDRLVPRRGRCASSFPAHPSHSTLALQELRRPPSGRPPRTLWSVLDVASAPDMGLNGGKSRSNAPPAGRLREQRGSLFGCGWRVLKWWWLVPVGSLSSPGTGGDQEPAGRESGDSIRGC
jgi:hypothetical protein